MSYRDYIFISEKKTPTGEDCRPVDSAKQLLTTFLISQNLSLIFSELLLSSRPLRRNPRFRKLENNYCRPIKSTEFAVLGKYDAKYYNIPPNVQVPKCKKPRAVPLGAYRKRTKDILVCESQHIYIVRRLCMMLRKRSGNEKFSEARNDGKHESLLLMTLRINNAFRRKPPINPW